MICIEVAFFPLEFLRFTNVDDGFAQSLGVAGFPVCSTLLSCVRSAMTNRASLILMRMMLSMIAGCRDITHVE